VTHLQSLSYVAIPNQSDLQIVFVGDNLCYMSNNDSAVKIINTRKNNSSDKKVVHKMIEFKDYDITGKVRLQVIQPLQSMKKSVYC